jgi:cytidyltransferase-like protein
LLTTNAPGGQKPAAPTDRVYVGGVFDLPHPGHLNLLTRAAEFGEVWVSLNTDEFAARYKRRPVMTLGERLVMVAALKPVTAVVVNTGCEDSRPAIEHVGPRWVVHGDDWTGDSLLTQLGVNREWLTARGIDLLYLPYTAGISTTDLRDRCG